MAGSGFFAGGFAEGLESSRKADLAERTLQSDVGLRTRGLELQERTLRRAEQQDDVKRGDELIGNTMTQVAEVIKNGLAVGTDPAKLQQVVAPMVQQAKAVAARVGRDPRSLDAQLSALLTGPTGTNAAKAAGVAKATKDIAEEDTLKAAGYDGLGKWKTLDEKVKAEGALRDDYQKSTKDFVTLRDFKDRIDTAPKTGAGDIALVFSYMKVLDPTSTVREGEYATAANSGGAFQVIGNLYNKLLQGDQLSEPARDRIKDAAGKIWTKASERHSALTNQFRDIAKRNRLDEKNVIVDPAAAPTTVTTPSGNTYTIQP